MAEGIKIHKQSIGILVFFVFVLLGSGYYHVNTVESLHSEVQRKNTTIAELESTINEKDQTINQKDSTISSLRDDKERLRSDIQSKDTTIEAKEETLSGIRNEASAYMTASDNFLTVLFGCVYQPTNYDCSGSNFERLGEQYSNTRTDLRDYNVEGRDGFNDEWTNLYESSLVQTQGYR